MLSKIRMSLNYPYVSFFMHSPNVPQNKGVEHALISPVSLASVDCRDAVGNKKLILDKTDTIIILIMGLNHPRKLSEGAMP